MEIDREAVKTPFQKSQKHSPHRRPMSILQPIALAENICGNVYNIRCRCNASYFEQLQRMPAVKAIPDRGAVLREQFFLVVTEQCVCVCFFSCN